MKNPPLGFLATMLFVAHASYFVLVALDFVAVTVLTYVVKSVSVEIVDVCVELYTTFAIVPSAVLALTLIVLVFTSAVTVVVVP